MSISLSSLLGNSSSSSIDSLVSQYMALEQKPIETLKTQKDQLSVRSAMFTDLRSKITALKSAAEDLAGINKDAITTPTTVFDSHTTSSSDVDIATATASSEAASGSYVLDNIVLAKAHRVQSTELASSWTASGDGTIVVNGAQIAVSAGDTLDDLRNAINSANFAADRGVVATVINVDSTHSRLILDASHTGTDYAISATDLSGSILSSLGLASTSSSAVAISSVAASSEAEGFLASNVKDGTTGDANSWHGGDSETSWTMTLDLGGSQTVDRLVWGRDQGGVETGGTPKDYTIEYLDDDGVTWNTLKTVTGNTLAAGAARTDTFYAVTTSKLRISVSATSDDTPPAIDEISLYHDTGSFSQAALQAASNASLTVNGIAVSGMSSNTLDGTVSGLTINLKDATGPVTLTVAADTSAMQKKITDFLSKLNGLVDYLKTKSAVTKGSDGNYTRGGLSGDSLYTSLQNTLGSDLLNQVTGVPDGGPTRLSELGITMDASSHFTISDSDKLNTWLSTKSSWIGSYFGGTDGIAKRIADRLEPYVVTSASGSASYLDAESTAITDQGESIDGRIADTNDRLSIREKTLRAQFTQLQSALIEASQMQQRLASLFSSTG